MWTYDKMIESGHWSGKHLELRTRMASYVVDGQRLGSISWKSQSGSDVDPTLDKNAREILAAALTLAHLGCEDVSLRAHAADGKPLERPDLDATIDGREIGIEVADVPGTPKHDAMKNRIEIAITELLKTDAAFRSAFGNHYFEVNLNPIGRWEQVPIGGSKEAEAITAELVAFIRCGLTMSAGANLKPFPPVYATLRARGCEYYLGSLESGAYFALGNGPTIGMSDHRFSNVMTVLDKHRDSARKGYRALSEIWMVLFLPDSDEFFRKTSDIVASRGLAIEPFKKCFLTDTVGTVVQLS
jgi:hypothetical protein